MALIWFCVALLVGIVIGDQLHIQPWALAAATTSLLVFGCIWWPKPNVRFPLLLAAAVLLGTTRIANARPVVTEHSVWAYTGSRSTIIGSVVQQPDRREDRQTALIAAEQLLLNDQPRAVEGLVLLRLPANPELRYGQRVRVEGRLELPKSGDEFDYRAYLARHGVYALMTKPKLKILPEVAGSQWQRIMLGLNDRARSTALQLISEPHASLLIGILLGVQSTIPADVLDAFSVSGTSHILVISGWNISVIIVGIAKLFQHLGMSRRRAAGLSLPIIGLYVLFVGATPSVARAAIMGSLAVVALLVERESEAWTSLLVACSVMALLDPHVLWDIGFQLSALATAGLFAFARPIEQRLMRLQMFAWRGLSWASEPLTATLAASSLSLPILLYHFGRLSLIAPLANVLMLPAVPCAMLFGSLATIGGMLWLPLGQILALLAWPFLQWLLMVASLLARVPGAYTTLPPFDVGWIWAYYIGVAMLYWWLQSRVQAAPTQETSSHIRLILHRR